MTEGQKFDQICAMYEELKHIYQDHDFDLSNENLDAKLAVLEAVSQGKKREDIEDWHRFFTPRNKEK